MDDDYELPCSSSGPSGNTRRTPKKNRPPPKKKAPKTPTRDPTGQGLLDIDCFEQDDHDMDVSTQGEPKASQGGNRRQLTSSQKVTCDEAHRVAGLIVNATADGFPPPSSG